MSSAENPKIEHLEKQILYKGRFEMSAYSYQFTPVGKRAEIQKREVFDRGDGAVVLLYNTAQKTVVLIRQFRLPTYLNANPIGMLLEACAGMVEKESPEDGIIREIREETGFEIAKVEKVCEAFMSPGALTERLYFYVAPYQKEQKTSEGGGLAEEQEHIEVMEMPIDEAMEKIKTGEICDAKTIILLYHVKLNGLV
jgi:GDP-mannose pyrophosphatase NudK